MVNQFTVEPAMVAEWSKSPCFKFKKRQMLRSQVQIPLRAHLHGQIDMVANALAVIVVLLYGRGYKPLIPVSGSRSH